MPTLHPKTKLEPVRERADAALDRDRIRFDKWLWTARFYKTRVLAAQAIDAGQARLNDLRVKPAHWVRAGDEISVRKEGIVWEVEVIGISDQRGPAPQAAMLYRESAESAATRERELQQRRAAASAEPRFPGRPTKRQRRKLADFLSEP
jgi:ribosome-associated heat shock protein Hsp15